MGMQSLAAFHLQQGQAQQATGRNADKKKGGRGKGGPHSWGYLTPPMELFRVSEIT